MPNSRLSQLSGIAALSIVAGLPLAHAQQGTAPSPATQAFTPPQPTPNDTLFSPEVSSDGHVTFRLYAPGAKKVMLQSEGLSPLPGSPRLRTEFGPSTSVQSNREYTGTAFPLTVYKLSIRASGECTFTRLQDMNAARRATQSSTCSMEVVIQTIHG